MNRVPNGSVSIDAHVNELLSGYLDGELTQQQQQKVGLHLEQCRQCTAELEDIRALRERMGQTQIGNSDQDQWREMMNDTGVRLSHGLGWLLFLGSLLILASVAIIAFWTDSSASLFMRLVVSALYIGWAALFVSVLRQRLIERKTDKYKDVEI
ncbi:anti-sigma factor family protein [Pseudomonadota bacterium]|jgi:hypothetical protein